MTPAETSKAAITTLAEAQAAWAAGNSKIKASVYDNFFDRFLLNPKWRPEKDEIEREINTEVRISKLPPILFKKMDEGSISLDRETDMLQIFLESIGQVSVRDVTHEWIDAMFPGIVEKAEAAFNQELAEILEEFRELDEADNTALLRARK